MTQVFRDMRLYGHIAVFLLAVTVLGIGADLVGTLSSNFHHDFSIFSVVVSSLTIAAFIILNYWSCPLVELIVLFVLGVLWLATGSWSADIMGSIQCDAINKSQRIATKSESMSARIWCYEMTIIEVFSWMESALFVIFILILITLTTRAKVFGRYRAWSEPILELPWFSEYPAFGVGESEAGESMGGGSGYYSPRSVAGYPTGLPPQAYGMPPQMANGGYYVPQQPGHSVVIRPGNNERPPIIEQVPARY
ncbi:uncharacterized protein PHACADRAFT_261870 [Phanerochaete carnosa HHB-10118-sp]|uniref:MARVEL domain-containing protein n=1 Tax=Phanerochaete carnosa (strain HHB-10118-sp) TaxID=650164 RepID=K5UPC1_PHACS|nr:uncharacterized protein PHACADRAFT_261870 [Phanerochaete carnosa HHB-10118-sp]EKM51621.1 hypothetical protein PHACADRAFT_261870 [Phanerochaete carnosa HHB-10118-sp]